MLFGDAPVSLQTTPEEVSVTTSNLKAASGLGQDSPDLQDGNADLFQLQRPAADPDPKQARRFLQLLGKDPARTWFRTLKPVPGEKTKSNPSRKGADLQGLDLAALTRDNSNGANVYLVVGDASSATGKGGGVQDADIETIPALFVEWDDMPMQWQLTAWETLNLPEPSLMVPSGGKSLHTYWLLDQPLPPDQWRALTARLIDYCNSDSNCCNPSRVMRLPGFAYIDKATGKPTGTIAEILHESDNRYSAAEIEDRIPAPEQPTIPAPAPRAAGRQRDQYPPHTLEEIQEAARYIPQRKPGSRDKNHYRECRFALSACASALAAIGRPRDEALELLGSKWPNRATAQQMLDSSEEIDQKVFWGIAKTYGHKQASTAAEAINGFEVIPGGFDLQAASTAADAADPSRAEVQRRTYSELVEATLAAAEHNDVDTYAELVAELMIRFRKPASAIQAALMRLLTERHATGAAAPKPGYTDITDVEHLDDLVPGFVAANEQTLLHAPKGTGKTLAALLIAKSVVLGQGMLDRSEAPQQGRVLYLATDSGCESMFTQMQELGLLELPEFRPGPEQRFFIRGHHARQGTSAWEATIPEILWLLREIQQQQFDLVIIDSAKACMELTDSDYTDNKAVGAMLTLFQRVICPHAAVLWLHHDGRENGHNAGAKVWAERPVMVHRLERVEPPKKGQHGGSGEDDTGPAPANPPRRWECIKSRVPGGERQFIYCLQPSGEFEVAPEVEIVGNCREAVLSVMRKAAAQGEESLRYAELVQRVERSSGRSLQTIKNTISRMKRGKEADLRPLSHGRYALSARARALGGVNVFGTKSDQNPVVERVSSGTDQGTDGTKSVPMESTGGTGSVPPSVPSKSKAGTGKTANGVPTHTHPRVREASAPPPQQVTIHIPAPAPTPSAARQLLGIGELVEVADRTYAPEGVFEVIEAEGEKLLIEGPQGATPPLLISVPAAQCEVVF